MKHKVYINVDGEWHKMYRPKKENKCGACSIEKYCVYVVGRPCTAGTIFKKVSKLK